MTDERREKVVMRKMTDRVRIKTAAMTHKRSDMMKQLCGVLSRADCLLKRMTLNR